MWIFLIVIISLAGGSGHDAVRTACGLDITAGEGLLVVDDEGQETREIAVLDRWYERFVLAERTREQHTQLRARDTRIIVRAVAGDRFMLGITLRKRHNRLNHCRQVLRLNVFGDVQILIRFHRRL